MIEYYSEFFHYGSIVSACALTALGASIGEGLIGKTAIQAMNQQPESRGEVAKTAILGMAITEASAIFGIVIALLVFFLSDRTADNILYSGLSHIGIAIAIGVTGLVIGIASALPAQEACMATARQPHFSPYISRFMLIVQSMIQTPIIFGFIVSMVIQNQAERVETLVDAIRLISAGIAIGLGSIGPAVGLALFSRTATKGIGVNRESYSNLFTFSFLSNAIIETPIIFAIIIALLILGYNAENQDVLDAARVFSAAICIGIGTMGPGISSGKTAAAACTEIVRNPLVYSQLSKVSMLAQGLIDTCAIYTLLVAILILF